MSAPSVTVQREMTYNGQVVATLDRIERHGLNFACTFTNGHTVIVPRSYLSEEVAGLAGVA